MAAGIVFHNITTASGVTFSLACWVPDTALPDVGAIAVSMPVLSNGSVVVPATEAKQDDLITAINSAASTEVDHDSPDAGGSLKFGFRAVALGTNPTGVAPADRSDWLGNRAGVPFFIGGHPNIITRHNVVLAADGAQTDAALLSVSAGSKIVVTQISAKASAANSGNTAVRVGFGTANVPTAALAGANGIILAGTFAANGGHQIGNGAGIIACGADGEDLRLTCGAPTGGQLDLNYSYFTIES